MNDIISQDAIESMTEQELRAKFHELFNTISQRQHIIRQCDDMQESLQRLQMEIYKRQFKPR